MSWKKPSWAKSSEPHKSILDELPRNEFAQWEIDLHSELARILHEVSNPFPLEEWINSRLGNKLELSLGPNCGTVISGDVDYIAEVASIADAAFDGAITKQGDDWANQPVDTPPKEEVVVPDESTMSQRDVLANLPTDTFTPEELELRDAIYDFIELSGRDAASLANLSRDENIQQRQTALAEANGFSTWKQIGLDKWINQRIGQEMEFRVKQKKRALFLKEEGEEHLRSRQRTSPQEFAETDDIQETADEIVTREDFFARLPADRFSAAEVALRESIYDYLISIDLESDVPLPELSADVVVTERRMQLAEENKCGHWKQIGLHDWIKKRLDTEMQIVRSKNPWTLHLTEAGRKEKFVLGLPQESFTCGEVKLRTALVDIVDSWTSGMPTLAAVQRRPDVLACIKTVLPVGCPLSLEEWIKCRIGGDIRVRMGALERA